MKRTLSILLFIILSRLLFAQGLQFQQEYYPFPLEFYGWRPAMDFFHGSFAYHPAFGDLDNDGDLDLVVGTGGNWLYYIENIGSATTPDYQIITDNIVDISDLSGLYTVPILIDIDDDEDLDFLIAVEDEIESDINQGYIRFFKNIGTPDSAIFEYENNNYLGVPVNQYPDADLVDIDNDNDYDLFIGIGQQVPGGVVFYFENTGLPDSASYSLVTNTFLGINVGQDASPEFADIDNDNDYDLFVGCYDGNIWFYENTGDSVNYSFELITEDYFDIDVGQMSVPEFVDIDDDGDLDLFVGSYSHGYTYTVEGDVFFYENTGTAFSANFEYKTGNYIGNDLGSGSCPRFADLDNDGLDELYFGATDKLVRFENVGSLEEPVFSFTDTSFCGVSYGTGFTPNFADIDNDEDLDIIFSHGTYTWGWIQVLENTGNITEPAFENESILIASVGYKPRAGICDIDADGDIDLFVGDNENHLHFFENQGSPERFNFVEVNSNYLNTPFYDGDFIPYFVDFDIDGDYDLFAGRNIIVNMSYYRIVEFWRNIGDPQNADFQLEEDSLFYDFFVTFPKIFSYDIDLDSDLDLFIGDGRGGCEFYRNLENPYQAQLTITVQDNDVILTWGAVADAVEYQIFYRDIPYFPPEGTPQAIVYPPDTVWTDYDVILEMQRFYRMITITP